MNQLATRQEACRPFWYGWFGSIVLHGLLILSLLPLFRQHLITIPQERFRWEVSLVHTALTDYESAQTLEPTLSKHPEPRPTPDRTARSSQHAASHIERTASLMQGTQAPTISELPPSTPALAEPSDTSSVISRSDEPIPSPSQTNTLPSQRNDPPIDSSTQTPPAQETMPATSAGEDAASTTLAQASSSPATLSGDAVDSAARPDYGWLQQAIFHRLEELKRSSRPSLEDSRPLKVLVKAVVSREGLLLDAAVVKSSGLDRIDQEAMALVQRAFPMHLDRPLDRQQVAMRIPITYSRD